MNSNKEILNYCPNYYNIVNFDFDLSDTISNKLVSIYKNYIFSTSINDKESINKINELDRVLNNYIKDHLFRSTLQDQIVHVKVKKDSNILRSIVDVILKIFDDYEEYTTRRIYISKWI